MINIKIITSEDVIYIRIRGLHVNTNVARFRR